MTDDLAGSLVCLCCQTTRSEARTARLEETLRAGPDWDRFLELGNRHDVVPLLHFHLSGFGPDLIPAAVTEELRNEARSIARRNLYLNQELHALFDALAEAGVEAISLKGPILAAMAYPSPALRRYSDLDVLVRRKDVRKAMAVLADRSYEPWETLSPAQEETLLSSGYSRPYGRKLDWIGVDLHWGFSQNFFAGEIEPARIWSEAEFVTVQGRPIRSLPRPLLPLALCVHGAKHGPYPWPKLKWIADMSELLRTRAVADWEQTFQAAESLRLKRVLLLGLALPNRLLKAQLPARASVELDGDTTFTELTAWIRAHLFGSVELKPSFEERTRFDLAMQDRASGRLRYLAKRTLLPGRRDWNRVKLPGWLTFLYVPLRYGRLIAKYGLHPTKLRRLRRKRSTSTPGRQNGD
ncbi:MAG: nucleotidyltransferase family protein [Gemmatimonadota bacterium]